MRHPVNREHRQGLTLGQRAADVVRNGMGSWWFVASAVALLACWMVVNSLSLSNQGFDPYPYILLNLTLSCLAAMQGAILLIAAKRQDRISADLAEHDYRADRNARTDVALILRLMIETHRHVTGETLDIDALMAEIRQQVEVETEEPEGVNP